jgi:hypothetical protein
MIASGEKKEEYREIKTYWKHRFLKHHLNHCDRITLAYYEIDQEIFKQFDRVIFRNGYMKNSPEIKLRVEEIYFGKGNPEWGAEPGKEYFVIKLGEIIQNPELLPTTKTP